MSWETWKPRKKTAIAEWNQIACMMVRAWHKTSFTKPLYFQKTKNRTRISAWPKESSIQDFVTTNSHSTTRKYVLSTALSKYIWELNEAKTKYTIKWSILKRVNAYRSGGKQCNLCLAEKLCILKAGKHTLNKKCRHENKFYVGNFKPL